MPRQSKAKKKPKPRTRDNRRKPRPPKPPVNLTGRPCKLNHELIDRLCNYIVRGNFIDVAVVLCGVQRSTFTLWMQRGQRLVGEINRVEAFMEDLEDKGRENSDEYARLMVLSKTIIPERDRVFIDLYHRVAEAEAQAECDDVDRLTVLSQADGGVLLRKMALRFQRWKNKDEVNHHHKHSGGVQHSHVHAAIIAVENVAAALPVDVQKQVLAALRGAREGNPVATIIAQPSRENDDADGASQSELGRDGPMAGVPSDDSAELVGLGIVGDGSAQDGEG